MLISPIHVFASDPPFADAQAVETYSDSAISGKKRKRLTIEDANSSADSSETDEFSLVEDLPETTERCLVGDFTKCYGPQSTQFPFRLFMTALVSLESLDQGSTHKKTFYLGENEVAALSLSCKGFNWALRGQLKALTIVSRLDWNSKEKVSPCSLEYNACEAHETALKGEMPMIRFLARFRPYWFTDVESCGLTPSHWAAKGGRVDVLKFIARRFPVSLGMPTEFGHSNETLTPAHISASYGGTEAFETCLEHAPDSLDAVNAEDGNTLAHTAAMHGNLEIFRICVDRKPSLWNVKNIDGNIPAATTISLRAFKCFEYAIQVSPQFLRYQNFEGSTPGHETAYSRNLKALKLVIQTDLDSLAITDNEGKTPAHIAAQVSWKEGLELMGKHSITRGLSLLALKDIHGNTPAHLALDRFNCQYSNTPATMLETIAKFEPDSLIEQNHRGEIPIELALRQVRDRHSRLGHWQSTIEDQLVLRLTAEVLQQFPDRKRLRINLIELYILFRDLELAQIEIARLKEDSGGTHEEVFKLEDMLQQKLYPPQIFQDPSPDTLD